MQEETFYALSDISQSLSFFRQPTTSWEELTRFIDDRFHWRTRYDQETRLLIEEQDNSKTRLGDWRVSAIHQGIEDRTKAIILAAHLTEVKQKLSQAQEASGSSTLAGELEYDPLNAF
jgi:hypothetical protein